MSTVIPFTIAGGGGGLADGNYGNVVVSGGGTAMSVEGMSTGCEAGVLASADATAQALADAAQAAAEATAASLAPHLVEAILDFGNGDTEAMTPISAAWATPASKITVTIVDDARIEDAILQQITVGASARAVGSFEIWGHAPDGADGQFTVHVLGV